MMFDAVLRAWRGIYGWLTLADYEAAKEKATDDIIARYARGNVNFQNGSSMDEEALGKLSAEGDRAMDRLRQRIPA